MGGKRRKNPIPNTERARGVMRRFIGSGRRELSLPADRDGGDLLCPPCRTLTHQPQSVPAPGVQYHCPRCKVPWRDGKSMWGYWPSGR